MILDLRRALVERWFHELFPLPHSTVLDQLVTDDFVTHDPSGKIGAPRLAALQTWLHWYRTGFIDATWEIQDLLSIGNKVVVRYAGQATYGVLVVRTKG